MTNKEALERLTNLGQDRQWLREATGYSIHSLNNAFSGDERELKDRMNTAFERAFSEEERRREVDLTKPGSSVWDLVYFNGLEVERIDRAKKAGGYSDLPSFYRDAVIDLADAILAKEATPESGKVTTIPRREEIASTDTLVAFPEIPLIHAAAGSPISADSDTFAPTKKIGAGRFAVKLHGDSMSPTYPHGSTVILHERGALAKPTLKKGQIYLFDVDGEKTLKVYNTRNATQEEIDAGISYESIRTHDQKVHVLQSLNPEYPEIVAKEPIDWIGWLNPKDNV